ncbi:MAG: peptidoglycan D,D-transpeptidase FtsI family protein, partial [Gammaproteobacteria bacterium]
GLSPSVGQHIKTLKIPGIYLQREYRRFYPEGEVTAHILGFTNIDDQGQEGMELSYDALLGGLHGLKRVVKDRLGQVVAEINTVREPHPGKDLALSIDRRIQYLAYRELKAGVEHYKAASGSAIVLDLRTGEILAMVNQPSFNPNNRAGATRDSYRNRAVTDVFEPGSTIKPFSMLSALSSGKFKPTSTVDTSPGWLILDGHRVSDPKTKGVMDMTTLLKRSSNVGITKLMLAIPPDSLWKTLNAVGFGQVTDSQFPGEAHGVLIPQSPWRHSFALATLSFGYGMSSTLLQLAQAYSVLGNLGVKRPMSLIKLSDAMPAGKQVVDAKAAKNILIMLESILAQDGGTAPLARVPGYRVTGKTSTTRIVGPKGYDKTRHNAGFTGLAPANQPQLLVTVFLHDLRGTAGTMYYGGYTAGPIFSRIMEGSLRLLGVPQDAAVMPAKAEIRSK